MTTALPTGTIIDNRYLIQRELGQGGMGRTYLAIDQRRFNEPCVLKEFVPSTKDEFLTQKSKELFLREAKVLYQLTHPQIPQFLAFFEENDLIFLVQEYINGQSYWQLLQQRQQQGKTFSEAEIVQWLKDLLPVLDYIHARKLNHRDISPDNIMLPKDSNRPVLIDFGVVKQVVTEIQTSPGGSNPVSLVGKVGYSPPEQLRTGTCYPSSDLYSLAVTALVLLTGSSPTELFDSYSLQWKQNTIGLSPQLDRILTKMLAENPGDRFVSAADVLAALQAAPPGQKEDAPSTVISPPEAGNGVASTTQVVQPRKPPVEQRSGTNIAVLGIVGALLIGGVGLAIGSPHINVLCKTLDNCARDQHYQEVYAQAKKTGEEAVASFDAAQNIAQLENSQIELNKAIQQLQSIPENVKVYRSAMMAINVFRSQLEQITAAIATQKQAQQQLAQTQQSIERTEQLTAQAKNIDQYRMVKAAWEAIQTELQSLPTDVYVGEQIEAHLTTADEQISQIEAKINSLVAEEKQKQEEQARRQEAIRMAQMRQRQQQQQPEMNPQTSNTPNDQPSQQITPKPQAIPKKNNQPPQQNSDYQPPQGDPLW